MKKVLLLIVTYLYVFSPIQPALGIGGIKFLYLLIPVLLLYTVKNNIIKTKHVFYSYMAFYLYLLIRGWFASSDTSQLLYDGTITFIEAFFIAHVVIYLHEKNSVNLIRSLKGCLYIASLSAILCLLSPSIKSLDENFLSLPNIVEGQEFRGYGIGCEQTYSYSISIAIIYTVLLFYHNTSNKIYFLLPFVAVSILINARTGFIVLCLGLLLFFLKEKMHRKPRILISICILGLLLLNFNTSFLLGSEVGTFALGFFDQMGALLSGESSDDAGNTLTLLLKAFDYYLPHTINEWLFGPGNTIGDEGKIIVMDSGFFNELYFGGIFYILLCFLIPFVFYKKLHSNHRYFTIFLFISCVILNVKGPFVPMAHGFKLISLVCMYFILHPDIIEQRRYLPRKK